MKFVFSHKKMENVEIEIVYTSDPRNAKTPKQIKTNQNIQKQLCNRLRAFRRAKVFGKLFVVCGLWACSLWFCGLVGLWFVVCGLWVCGLVCWVFSKIIFKELMLEFCQKNITKYKKL